MPEIEFSRQRSRIPPWLRFGLVLGLIYLFLVAITMLGGTFKALGKEQAESLVNAIDNPFASLAVGILATVLVQSSSVTTSMVVALVGKSAILHVTGNQAPTEEMLFRAIEPFTFMMMGANIGTTVTNTLASLGSITRSSEFEKAFAGATMHDFFNLLMVVVLLPIEYATGFLAHTSVWAVGALDLDQGLEFHSPIKSAVKAGYGGYKSLMEGIGLSGTTLTVILAISALVLIFVCLVYVTRNMKLLMANRLERAINRALEKTGLIGILIGLIVTVLVQSSSITTSILIPMFAAGLLTVENGFPITLGANVGTTVTALLAAIATGPAGLAIAFVHLFFNLTGILLFYPVPAIRRVPVRLALGLAHLTGRSRWWVLIYVVGVFVLLPLLGIVIFQ